MMSRKMARLIVAGMVLLGALASSSSARDIVSEEQFGDLPPRLGSITKTMTATLVLQLVSEGKLSLDAPLSDWDAAFPYGCGRRAERLYGVLSPDQRAAGDDGQWRRAGWRRGHCRVW